LALFFLNPSLGDCTVKKLLSHSLLALGLLAAASGAWAQDKVKIVTNMGDIVVELDAAKAPKTVANFEQYVREKFYAGTLFHRVINDFMIQGGGMNEQLQEKPPTHAPIALETSGGLKNERGTIAMARTNDPNSATTQFFINVKDNDFLNPSAGNPGYAVFGKVVQGMDVVDKIKVVPTSSSGMYQNVPAQAVLIKEIVMIEPKAAGKKAKPAHTAKPAAAAKPQAPQASGAQ